MPKTKFQEVIFTILMAAVMVYGMVCYNIAVNTGGFTNHVFVAAFNELPIMTVVAVALELIFVGTLSKIVAFRLVDPVKSQPFFIVAAISVASVWIMCPCMSFAAAVLFKGGLFQREFLSIWIKTTVLNYPMAFFWQFFVAGPLVRMVFRSVFRERKVLSAEGAGE